MQTIADERKPWTYEFMTHTEVSEDCLYLNVWTAATSASEKRPVYVYIYGGANTEGSGAVPVYDGEGLARKGIVLVTVNYRLGVLGFFTHPELTKESESHASGNYALLDLIAALRWVHDNIAAFGGDPGNVTVGGQSAGASNTHSLTASPAGQRALPSRHRPERVQHRRRGGRRPRTLADQEQLGVKFAEAKGARSLADLRAMSWKDLSAPVAPSSTAPAPAFRFGVVVDGYVLPASVRRRVRIRQAERRADPHRRQQARGRRDAASGRRRRMHSRSRRGSATATSPTSSWRSIPRRPTNRRAWRRTRAPGIRPGSRCICGL